MATSALLSGSSVGLTPSFIESLVEFNVFCVEYGQLSDSFVTFVNDSSNAVLKKLSLILVVLVLGVLEVSAVRSE